MNKETNQNKNFAMCLTVGCKQTIVRLFIFLANSEGPARKHKIDLVIVKGRIFKEKIEIRLLKVNL